MACSIALEARTKLHVNVDYAPIQRRTHTYDGSGESSSPISEHANLVRTSSQSTTPDPGADDWELHDDLVRLREWGSDIYHALPASASEWVVGSSASCSLRLRDSSSRVSRRHARLVRTWNRWSIQDLGSKNGLWVDGARCEQCVLEPGVEVRLGGITLIAESPRSIALRSYLSRLLGWRTDQVRTVDLALRSLRLAAARRSALILCGPDDLVPIAHGIHRRALGPDRPFIVCDPRRQRSEGTVRSAANIARAVPALRAAAGGSLCIRGERLPRDLVEALPLVRRPSAHVQLILCARKPARSDLYVPTAISVPPLSRRANELGWIIAEYADDAIAQLGAPRGSFTPRDREWVRRHAASSLAEVEKTTLRMIAIRVSSTTSQAAERLGMSHAALSAWLERKRLG
jgi:FHA domain-containing protein